MAYAQALDLLLKPQWPLQIVDMVLQEVTRNAKPTSEAIRVWIQDHDLRVVATHTGHSPVTLALCGRGLPAALIRDLQRFRKTAGQRKDLATTLCA